MYASPFEAMRHTRKAYQAPIVTLADNHYFLPDILTEAQGFDLENHLQGLKGPTVEVGGPTVKYNPLLGITPPKNTLVTNISNHQQWEGIDEKVAMLADAKYLPFANESLGTLFSSYLPQTDFTSGGEDFNLRHAFFREATRVLEPNGLLVYQDMPVSELEYADSLGLTPMRVVELQGTLPATGDYTLCAAILMKTTGSEPPASYSAEAIGMPAVGAVPALGTTAIGGVGVETPGT